jgi:ABC-2 type transport system permease protein
MNTQSNTVPESFGSRPANSAVVPATRPLYWSLRREFWEYRSLYIAPLAAAAVFLFGFALSLFHLPAKVRAAGFESLQQRLPMDQAYSFSAFLLMATTLIVAVFYCLDALHGERRDRSILFWKSLPVSDLTTVLSKAIIPLFVLPLITFGITFALWVVMLLLGSVVLMGSGLGAAAALPYLSFPQMSMSLLYHLVAFHGLWYAPFYGWLLLVSAWARRVPFLWATVPLLTIGIFEKMAFNTAYFAGVLGYRFGGGGEDSTSKATEMSLAMLNHFSPGQFLASPGLWVGLLFAAACLAAAVRLRRSRDPI